jgi:hypothetical protein
MITGNVECRVGSRDRKGTFVGKFCLLYSMEPHYFLSFANPIVVVNDAKVGGSWLVDTWEPSG